MVRFWRLLFIIESVLGSLPHSPPYQLEVGTCKANNLVVIGSILTARSTALNLLEDMSTSVGQKGRR